MSFSTEDNKDIAALLRMHDSWSLKIDDDSPTYYIYHLEESGPITIDPQSIIDNPAKVGLEVHAIKMIHNSINSFFNNLLIENETYSAVYKICLAGKKIDPADEMRLVVLWLWDKINTESNKQVSFDTAYKALKDKANQAHLSDGVWDQILYRKQRIRGYYQSVAQSIAQLTVIPLNSK